MLGFLILVTKNCSKTFRKCLEIRFVVRPGKVASKMTMTNCSKKRGRKWAAKSNVEISGEFLLAALVSVENSIGGLMRRRLKN